MQTWEATPIRDVKDLEERLSRPTEGVTRTLSQLQGDILILGVGGKMGPTLARMAKRASEAAGVDRKIICVARFSQAGLEARLQSFGLETIPCDLLDPVAISQLPTAPNVVFMAGMKFGTSEDASLTWVMNVDMPALVCRRFSGSKIVAFSTGNVYPLAPVTGGGACETDPVGPVGEYAMSCLGREQIFQYYSHTAGTPVALLRLSYAVEMRYGVLVDIARRVYNGEPIDLKMGNMVAIWQGDANAMSLQAFDHVANPPCILNITGPDMLSIRQIALVYGEIFNKKVTYTDSESGQALISNAQKAHRLFGYPQVPIAQVIAWCADWVARNGESLNKPTHFETTDGKF